MDKTISRKRCVFRVSRHPVVMEVKIGAGRKDEVILLTELSRSPSITAIRLHFG